MIFAERLPLLRCVSVRLIRRSEDEVFVVVAESSGDLFLEAALLFLDSFIVAVGDVIL